MKETFVLRDSPIAQRQSRPQSVAAIANLLEAPRKPDPEDDAHGFWQQTSEGVSTDGVADGQAWSGSALRRITGPRHHQNRDTRYHCTRAQRLRDMTNSGVEERANLEVEELGNGPFVLCFVELNNGFKRWRRTERNCSMVARAGKKHRGNPRGGEVRSCETLNVSTRKCNLRSRDPLQTTLEESSAQRVCERVTCS